MKKEPEGLGQRIRRLKSREVEQTEWQQCDPNCAKDNCQNSDARNNGPRLVQRAGQGIIHTDHGSGFLRLGLSVFTFHRSTIIFVSSASAAARDPVLSS